MFFLRSNRVFFHYGRHIRPEPMNRIPSYISLNSFFTRCSTVKVNVRNSVHKSDEKRRSPCYLYVFSSPFHKSIARTHIEMVPDRISSCIFISEPLELQNKQSSPHTSSSKATAVEGTDATPPPEGNSSKAVEPKKPKKSLWIKFKEELIHYYHGFRLLGVETRIAGGIVFRVLSGHTLTRRERKQLVRTVADIVRLVPFAVFIIVPFMELLLPVYLKFFPFMLPSTFQDKGKEELKKRQRLVAKMEFAKFLQDTVTQVLPVDPAKAKNIPRLQEFQNFLKTVRESGQLADTKDIVRFSSLFEDEVTLANLNNAQLRAICNLLEVTPIGTSNIIRLQLQLKVQQLKEEDESIKKEGLEKVPAWELQPLCRKRGMRTLGLTEERLRSQLGQWIELHLDKDVPLALLLLSRALYIQDTTLPPEQQLTRVIMTLPETVKEQATVKALDKTEDIDARTRVAMLRQEQSKIEEERDAAEAVKKAEAAAGTAAEAVKTATTEARQAAEVASLNMLRNRAEILEPKFSEHLQDTAEKLLANSAEKPPTPILDPSVESTQPPSERAGVRTADAEVSEPLAMAEEVVKATEAVVSSKDIDSLKDAIASMEETKMALADEHLMDLRADLEEAVKQRQVQQESQDGTEKAKEGETLQLEAETKAPEEAPEAAVALTEKIEPTPTFLEPKPVPTVAAEEKPRVIEVAPEKDEKKAEMTASESAIDEASATEAAAKAEVKEKLASKRVAKTEKAVKRLGKQVDRLLGEIDGLMENLISQKQDLLKEIEVKKDKVKAAELEHNEEKKGQLFETIRTNQQNVLDINDVLASLKRLQASAGTDLAATRRWQMILDAMDEDHDGKIEFKHLLQVLELFEKENVELKTSELQDVVEMFEQEEQKDEDGRPKEKLNGEDIKKGESVVENMKLSEEEPTKK